jgi:putative transposase
MHCEVLELKCSARSLHLVVIVPPKISISMGHLGRSAIRLYNRFPHIWGNHGPVATLSIQ